MTFYLLEMNRFNLRDKFIFFCAFNDKKIIESHKIKLE